MLFVLSNLNECRFATHVIYDFAGTARAHPNIPFLQRPYAVWIHGCEVWPGAPQKYLQAIRGASLVLANSAYTLRRAGAVFPTGIDVKICPLGTLDDSSPATVGPSNGPPTVMLLGRADELFAKGHDILISIWPRIVSAVPDARLLLVGGGSTLDKVRDLAAASPARERIEVVGFVQEAHLERYWKRATVFAMLGFAEGFGLVYVEAMRHGLPVIASTDDAAQEVNVDGVTGFNIARSDTNRLAEVLIALLRDRDAARRLGASGHACWRRKYAFSAFSQRLRASTAEFLST
jgi:phosphatidylinositol alpha-1,6-mannosyltransferase